MLTAKLDTTCEAYRLLNRLTQIVIPKKIMRDIAKDLQRDSRLNYWKKWGHRAPRTPHNIYTAVKQAAFGRVIRGSLTGSTINAIQGSYNTNMAGVGWGKYSWPTGSGRAKFRAQEVVDILDEMGKLNSTLMKRVVYFGTGRITWTTAGVRIMWPRSLQNMGRGVIVERRPDGSAGFGIIKKGFKDFYFPSEPFENKIYGRGKRGKDFFILSRDRQNAVLEQIELYIERIISGEQPVAREIPGPIDEPVQPEAASVMDTRELIGEEGRFSTTSRQEEFRTLQDERGEALRSLKNELKRQGMSQEEIERNMQIYLKIMREEE